MSDKISDRISDSLAWDTLSLAQWHALISEMIRRRDIGAIPGVLALMAVHGYATEAEDLRHLILLMPSHGGSECTSECDWATHLHCSSTCESVCGCGKP